LAHEGGARAPSKDLRKNPATATEPHPGGGVVKCLTTVRIALTGRGIPEYRASVVTVKAWQKTKRKGASWTPPDDTPIARVRLPSRLRNVLEAAGLKTIGEVRETADDTLLSSYDFSKGSVVPLREILGLPSCHGVRPARRG